MVEEIIPAAMHLSWCMIIKILIVIEIRAVDFRAGIAARLLVYEEQFYASLD